MLLDEKQAGRLKKIAAESPELYEKPDAETIALWTDFFKARLNDLLPGGEGVFSDTVKSSEDDLNGLFEFYKSEKFSGPDFRHFNKNGPKEDILSENERVRGRQEEEIRGEVRAILRFVYPSIFKDENMADLDRAVNFVVEKIVAKRNEPLLEIDHSPIFSYTGVGRSRRMPFGGGMDFFLRKTEEPKILEGKLKAVKNVLSQEGFIVRKQKLFDREDVVLIWAERGTDHKKTTIMIGTTNQDASYIFNRDVAEDEFIGVDGHWDLLSQLGGFRIQSVNKNWDRLAEVLKNDSLFVDVGEGLSNREFAIAAIKKAFPTREDFRMPTGREMGRVIFPGGLGLKFLWTFVFGKPKDASSRITNMDLDLLEEEVYGKQLA